MSVLGGNGADVHDRLRVVGVDVEDGRVGDARHIGAVGAGAGRAGVGGEADLVVDHDVDGAVGCVGGQIGQVEGLEDNALAGKGGVAMQ